MDKVVAHLARGQTVESRAGPRNAPLARELSPCSAPPFNTTTSTVLRSACLTSYGSEPCSPNADTLTVYPSRNLPLHTFEGQHSIMCLGLRVYTTNRASTCPSKSPREYPYALLSTSCFSVHSAGRPRPQLHCSCDQGPTYRLRAPCHRIPRALLKKI